MKNINKIIKRISSTVLTIFSILFIVPILFYYLINEIIFRIKFHHISKRTNKRIILVYSNSPNWFNYIENNLIPLLIDKCYILNWSKRSEWNESNWEIKAFRHWGGNREFNPLIIISINFIKVKVIRLYKAFIDYKHGKDNLLKIYEKEIQTIVSSF